MVDEIRDEEVVTTEPVVGRRPVVAERPAVVERSSTVVQRPAAVEYGESRAAQIIYLILSIVEILLAFRLVMRLLGANSANGFVSFIYSVTYPLIYPFIGIFSLPRDLSVASLELATLIAMVVYAVVAYIIVALVRISKNRP